MKMKFIELDHAGDPIWVNPEMIRTLIPVSRGTDVHFGPDDTIHVSETSEEIIEKIGI